VCGSADIPLATHRGGAADANPQGIRAVGRRGLRGLAAGGSYAVLAGQRSSDHHRGEEIAPGLIAVQFPDLAGRRVARLETGREHELCTAGGVSIVRSPRRAERAAWLTRELQITAIVAETLGPVIPVFEPTGEPCDAFPDRSLAAGGCRARALTRLAGGVAGWQPASARRTADCTASPQLAELG
jgi:hypothetical protein